MSPPPSLARNGWVWESDATGVYTWCSPEIERLTGFGPKDALGLPVASLALEPGSARMLEASLRSFQPIRNLRTLGRTRQGEFVDLLINALPRTDASGARLGYRGVTQVFAPSARPERPQAGPPRTTMPQPAPSPQPPPAVVQEGIGFVDEAGRISALRPPEPGAFDKVVLGPDRLLVPIQIGGQLQGFIELAGRDSGQPWDEEDARLLGNAVQQLALAIQDARALALTEAALDDMREADRLKSQFLANMSHELRTPLNSIIGFSRVILKGIDGPVTETQEQDLTAIHSAGLHLLGLINDILDLSKIEAGKMELAFSDVDLREIIRGVMTTAAGLARDKPIELSFDYPDDLPIIQADSIRVRQILLNLVSNAAKFTERGRISVTARVQEHEGRPEVLFCVSDTGPGISPKDQRRLFEAFSQVDASPTRKTGGTGLGLSICRHLVDLHGGRIWVRSVPGQGSEFFFTLPLQPPGPAGASGN